MVDDLQKHSEDFPLPRTPEPESPPTSVPSVSDNIPSMPSFSLEAYQVIQKERQRQMRIEQGIARGIAIPKSSDQLQVLQSDVDCTSLDSIFSPGSEGGTPRQRFCLIDLVDDSDAIYGRIQWANDCENSELSVYQRQHHADQLALRFLQYTACGQSRPFMPSRTLDQEQQPLKLPELHHPCGILSEDSATEQRGRPHGVVQEPEGGNSEPPNDIVQKESA
ncbi:hypothetical protein EV426DRAFT_230033 [Tirmania nivea]|nr:hypothetical protein EV426DRAFT_230033 [Tirmania nivea]